MFKYTSVYTAYGIGMALSVGVFMGEKLAQLYVKKRSKKSVRRRPRRR